MRIRAPLYAKIGGRLLANLALVALLIGGFIAVQYHLGLDSLLAGRAGDRVEAVAGVIAAELRESEPGEWNAILERFSTSYQVKFSLCLDDGTTLAGEHLDLPPSVRAKLADTAHRLPPAPRGPPGREDPPPPDAGLPAPPRPGQAPPRPPAGRPTMLHTTGPSQYWVLVRLPVRAPAPGRGPRPGPPITLVAISGSLGGSGLFVEFTPWIAVALAVLVVSILCWLPLVRGLTRALRRLTEVTGRIAEGRFDVRVTDENRGDELGVLAGSINRMAARLDGFVTGQKRFLGDIAHELCAPLARLQMAAGILEQRATPETRANVADLNEEIEQMSALVGELLSFSKASLAGRANTRLAVVELLPVIDQAVRRESPSGSAQIEVLIPAGLAVMADPDLLLRAVSNLLRNAIRYAADAGPITISAELVGNTVRLRVCDRGPGVPADALAKVFDPFYRLDASRDRATGGVGLGLAIVKTCAEACGAAAACRNLEPSGFEVTLALQPAPAEISTPMHGDPTRVG